ncbi:MAG: E3 binding domain-containing protein, partial [Solirubrobacterales bacterium]|nr:E3 binding domain-containing protein [Solirubrobacterales bacterium]
MRRLRGGGRGRGEGAGGPHVSPEGGPLEVSVPDIGEFTDVPVVEVLVAVGDEVEVEAPLIVLETDKASMEVPAPQAGTVSEVKVSVGDTVSEGTVIATLEPAGEDGGGEEASASSGAGASAEAPASSDAGAAAEAEAESDGAGAGGEGDPAEKREPAEEGDAAPSGEAQRGRDGDAPVYASPSVRRLARERGIDLTTVTGSGRRGRIVPEDLDRLAQPQAAPTADDGAGL